jgi:PAS domain S-box-containing protein
MSKANGQGDMSTSTRAACDTAAKVNRPSLPRWHRLFYLLVAFAVCTVLLSLYLSHQYMQIYVRVVAVNQDWMERLHGCAQLGQLAAAVNAPGNDVFQSNQADIEEAKMHVALRLLNERLEGFEEGLRANPTDNETGPLLEDLQTVREHMRQMATEAQGLFAHVRRQQTKEAGESMAAMDREYARAYQVLERVRGEMVAIEKRHFEHQAAVAASLQRFQYTASALILLMIGASVVYGHQIRRQVESLNREKEGYIEALQDSETQLDRRVRERTAELVQANESLRKEIQDRQRAEGALHQSEGRYRQLIDSTHDLIQSITPEGRFLFVNPAWLQILGYNEADVPGLSVYDVVHLPARPRFRSFLARVLAGKFQGHMETTLVAKDGRLIQVEGNATGCDLDGQRVMTHCFFSDVTERNQASYLRQQLLKKLISAQEDERRRIARDLHDEIGQALTSLLIGLRAVAETLSLEAAHFRANDLRRIAISTLEEVRRLARGLRPSVLVDLGLTAALERYAVDYAQAHGIAVDVQAQDPDPGRLPEEIETALYRIAQEALTNTAKHSAAKRVGIVLRRQPDAVQLVVSDDGCGFESRGQGAQGRLGLSGMQERAALLNGSVIVDAKPGRGTRVTVRIPCAEDTHAEDSCARGG